MQKLNQIHNFKSYSAHRLFPPYHSSEDNNCGWGGMLDKYYETDSYPSMFSIRPLPDKKIVDYRVMNARPNL